MNIEFYFNGHKYKAAKLNAMQQWHIFRRLAPTFAKFASPEMIKIFKASKSNADEAFKLFEPFAEAIGEMSDDDSEKILNMCCGCTQRQVEANWQFIGTPDSLMFEDIDLLGILRITFEVIMGNLGNFSFASLQR